VRKLVIKPFKVQPKLPENFFQETWAKLQSALHAVYSKNASSISKEELYRAVEDLCVQKFPVQLYENLNREIEAVSRQKVGLLRSSSSLDASAFLAHVETIWLDHCEQLSTIRNIFLYLDRYVAASPGRRAL
jgi:cullin-4